MSCAFVARGKGSTGRWAVALSLVLGLAAIASPRLAWAQQEARPSEPQRADVEPEERTDAQKRMHALNEEGFAAFSEGEFVEAARKFEEAHSFHPDPNLRKNAAIAWFKAGRCEEASDAAAYFLLADEMTLNDRIEARTVLGHCRLDEAEEALASGELERAGELLDYVGVLETDERVDERLASLEMRLTDAGAAPAEDDGVGWIVTGLGTALLVGNAMYHAVSTRQADRLDRLEKTGDHAARRRALQNNVDRAEWLVPTLYAVGGVTTGAGLYLTLTAGGPDTEEPAGEASQRKLRAPAPSFRVGFTTAF